ncbi:S8 family peptidase [Brevundimonas sp.]|uniref:S8 family peptidase n=1 Tax=Brevundimonas sp. TaxID=1871086 RepID=UPI003D11DBC9
MQGKAWTEITRLAEDMMANGAQPEREDQLAFHVEARDADKVDELRTRLEMYFGALAKVRPLFDEPDAETRRFLAVVFPAVDAELAAPVAWDAAYALAASDPDIRSVEPDLPTGFFIEPDEPVNARIAAESAIVKLYCEVDHAPPADRHWAIKMIKARDGAAFSRSIDRPAAGHGVLVAQPDTGVTANAELEAGSIAPDGGWDVIEDRVGATDPLIKGNPGHGTATGSCVISRTRGKVEGSAPAATLYPIRAITSVVIHKAGPVARAIERAILVKAQVVTMSLGGVPSRAVRAAIRRARSEGIIVLAAAGNCVKLVVWPARYPECIAVAGCNIYGMPWKGTSRGPSVDITAPGEQVWHASAQHPDGYKHGQGTSFAVALTAGAAAQWIGHFGTGAVKAEAARRGVPVHELFRTALMQTATPSSLLDPQRHGAGVVNVEALLKLELSAIGTVKVVVELPGDDPGDNMPQEYEEIYRSMGGSQPEGAKLNWALYGGELGAVALRRAMSMMVEKQETLENTQPALSSHTAREAAISSGDPTLMNWLGVVR